MVPDSTARPAGDSPENTSFGIPSCAEAFSSTWRSTSRLPTALAMEVGRPLGCSTVRTTWTPTARPSARTRWSCDTMAAVVDWPS